MDTNPQPQFKICSQCGLKKAASEYHKRKKSPDGLQLKCKACFRLYQRENRKRIREVKRAYYEEKHATIYAYSKAWRRANPDKVAEFNRAYRDRNPGIVSKVYANKQAKHYGVDGELTKEDVDNLFNTYPYCLACGADERTVDHVIPLSKGGPNTFDNLQTLCLSCNSKKHAKTIDYRFGPQMEVK